MIKFKGFNLWDWIVSHSRVYRDLEDDAEAMYYALVENEMASNDLPVFGLPATVENRLAIDNWLDARIKGGKARRTYRERR